VNDGGWTVCTAGPYNLSSSSRVISGGIAKDWSFDTDITKKYGCRLDAFDPTIDYINDTTWKTDKILFHKIGLSAKTHITEEGWRLMSLGDIIDTFVGPGATVDYLKFDIEDYEVELIEQAVADGSLQRAKQVAFEIHVRSAFLIDPARLKRIIRIFILLETNGFLKWHYYPNPYAKCLRTPTDGHLCGWINVHYINANYLPLAISS